MSASYVYPTSTHCRRRAAFFAAVFTDFFAVFLAGTALTAFRLFRYGAPAQKARTGWLLRSPTLPNNGQDGAPTSVIG
jgi:hypothetical protein